MSASGKIMDFLRNYVMPLSIILIIVGLIVFLMGVIWYGLRDLLTSDGIPLGVYSETIENLGDWNFYLLIIGFIALLSGIYYLYSYIKNKRFILEKLKTNKRSEFIKNHGEMKSIAKHLPNKYRKMLKEKERELKVK